MGIDEPGDGCDALVRTGLRHHQAGRLAAAVGVYERVLDRCPDHGDALHLRGLAAHQAGEHAAAARWIERAIEHRPTHPGFHTNLGEVYRALGRADDAAACHRRALQLKPDFAEAHNNLGNLFYDQGRCAEAVACYRGALAQRGHVGRWHTNLGNALAGLERFEDAIDSYRRALKLSPKDAETHNVLGMALRRAGRLDAAEAALLDALAIQPDYVMALNNLGVVLKEQGRLDAAGQVLGKALRLRPGFLEARDSLGIVRLAQGRFEEAIACFDAVLERQPANAQAHWNRALTWLAAGDDERGWAEYEWRFEHDPALKRSLPAPRWDGASLGGRTILLHAEQGLGDVIMFSRFVPLVAEAGGRVLLECQPALMRLLGTLAGVDRLVPAGADLPSVDCHTPLPSLPLALGSRLDALPPSVPYLSPEPDLVHQVRAWLPVDGLRHVGLNWQGNPRFANDRFRSLPLELLAPLGCVHGIRLCSIQHGAGHEQLAAAPPTLPVHDLGARLDAMAPPPETDGGAHRLALAAAALAALDLLITTDTMVAHLAGALGRPVWLLLSHAPDWRWQRDRADSAWYPTVRLFRQRAPGDWASVITAVVEALAGEGP